jgi:DNA polymerase III subunit epsilon
LGKIGEGGTVIVLGLDLETTGLEAGTCNIIEVGAVLWDWSRKTPLRVVSELVECHEPLPAEITELTGIADTDLRRWGVPLVTALTKLQETARDAEYVVAHNGINFDRLFLERAWSAIPQTRFDLEWIDTCHDLPLPKNLQTRKLSYLAAEMGFLNPFAHRSVFDVLTMLKVLSHYPPEDVLRLQKSPLRRLVAQVSYDERDKAKAHGFRWDPQRRYWYLEGKECLLETRVFPFRTVAAEIE